MLKAGFAEVNNLNNQARELLEILTKSKVKITVAIRETDKI